MSIDVKVKDVDVEINSDGIGGKINNPNTIKAKVRELDTEILNENQLIGVNSESVKTDQYLKFLRY